MEAFRVRQKLPEQSAEEYHEALQSFNEVGIPLTNVLAERLGIHVIILMVGPTSKIWGEFDWVAFTAAELLLRCYGRAFFTKDQCRAHAWLPLEGEILDSLILIAPEGLTPIQAPLPLAMTPAPVPSPLPPPPPPLPLWGRVPVPLTLSHAVATAGSNGARSMALVVNPVGPVQADAGEGVGATLEAIGTDGGTLRDADAGLVARHWAESRPADLAEDQEWSLCPTHGQEPPGAWAMLRTSGDNGMLLVVQALMWWGQSIVSEAMGEGLGAGEAALGADTEWHYMLEDVMYSLGAMTETITEEDGKQLEKDRAEEIAERAEVEKESVKRREARKNAAKKTKAMKARSAPAKRKAPVKAKSSKSPAEKPARPQCKSEMRVKRLRTSQQRRGQGKSHKQGEAKASLPWHTRCGARPSGDEGGQRWWTKRIGVQYPGFRYGFPKTIQRIIPFGNSFGDPFNSADGLTPEERADLEAELEMDEDADEDDKVMRGTALKGLLGSVCTGRLYTSRHKSGKVHVAPVQLCLGPLSRHCTYTELYRPTQNYTELDRGCVVGYTKVVCVALARDLD
ncbi:hypothetical protein K438DRAFT_1771119 [Mycena galopus ATCC 62051]|nr:hypothetical protein K438DRAFT_1771119 [Mycena galopus ATCC 62051]